MLLKMPLKARGAAVIVRITGEKKTLNFKTKLILIFSLKKRILQMKAAFDLCFIPTYMCLQYGKKVLITHNYILLKKCKLIFIVLSL